MVLILPTPEGWKAESNAGTVRPNYFTPKHVADFFRLNFRSDRKTEEEGIFE